MKIVLITGGPSAERDVSVNSSISILKALRENGHDVTVIDPVFGSSQPGEDEILSHKASKESPTAEELARLRSESNRKILDCFSGKIFDNVDFAFLGVHGKFGEDGRLQALLEMRGISYSGSGVFASALAMDKDITKVVLNSKGIRTPSWISVTRSEFAGPETLSRKIAESFGYPCVAKPNDEGSTVGLSIVSPDVEDVQLGSAVELALSYSEKALIEQFVKGREITVPVIGDEVFPVIEIRPKGGFYDYEHKYTKGMTEYFCPAEIGEELTSAAQSAALLAHRALGCSVYSRVDFIIDSGGDLQCLEVNTLPGMTETSLVPKSAQAKGMSFNELIETIIQLSIKGH